MKGSVYAMHHRKILTPPHLSGMVAVLDRWGERGENWMGVRGGGGYGCVRENIRGGEWIWPIMKGLLTPPHLSGMIAILDRWGDRGENWEGGEKGTCKGLNRQGGGGQVWALVVEFVYTLHHWKIHPQHLSWMKTTGQMGDPGI